MVSRNMEILLLFFGFLPFLPHESDCHLSFDYRFTSSKGLFPSVFNIAQGSEIFVNATCGEPESEVYCTLASVITGSSEQLECGVCDDSKSDKAHAIESSVDGTNSWWQSPSLQYGPEFNYVTIIVDLKKVFQVAYILIQSGPSPRPGNWVLERSINGHQWAPWQFFAISDEECWHSFGIEPTKGKPEYNYDEEVICTSYYSGVEPMQDGEIHISLVNGRPGASGPSQTLVDFTQARFIRMRFQKLRLLPKDQRTMYNFLEKFRLRQYFYSIRDITIGGQCPCNGHASECPVDDRTMAYVCKCQHNTCGPLCDQCCPMYNQKRWRPGKFITGNECELCQCFGHANECFFDPQVEAERRSQNVDGNFEGGGVCIGCKHNTTGVNCEVCKKGFYRPDGVSRYDPNPCRVCQCDTFGSTGFCYPDESLRHLGHLPGHCVCKPGYAGATCTRCAKGFHQYPKCAPCPCSLAGTLNGECDGQCLCKQNVQGERCDQCKPGYYALHESNPKGCYQCFCYAITNQCEAAELGVETLQLAEGWKASDLRGGLKVDPYWSTMTSGVTIANEDMNGSDVYFWEAPEPYIGNKLLAYGQKLSLRTSWHRGRGDTAGTYIKCPDILLQGDGMLIGTGFQTYKNDANTTIEVMLLEDTWYHIPDHIQSIPSKSFINEEPEFIGRRVFKDDFMRILGSLERILIRAKYHTDQLEGSLFTAALDIGSQTSANLKKTSAVEKCICPPGYEGLSCQSCSFGYTRVNNILFDGTCQKCDCNAHAATCDPFTFKCGECGHNTEGDNCEKCKTSFYGNPLLGTPEDCKPCKCPMEVDSNNFSPTCEAATLDYDKYAIKPDEYICTECQRGYAGAHCERCDNGYFGNPLKVGDFCKPCDCSGNSNTFESNWCDHRTGECLKCLGNTGGWKCDICLEGFWGNPFSGGCEACDCNTFGSLSSNCDRESGQCPCKDKYTGRTCGQCKDGFGNVAAGCRRCDCDQTGSTSDVCDADTGQCPCKKGTTGLTCSGCLSNFYDFSDMGCKECKCHPQGSKSGQCNDITGKCPCRPNVISRTCGRCKNDYWNINSGKGCQECNCDPMGAYGTSCNDRDGQCECKPGIGGISCDRCLEGFWGFSSRGCTKCAPCDTPGHVCDPDTGLCVCPRLTEGRACERCVVGAWDYNSYLGCKACNCNLGGSLSPQCDSLTGLCHCLEGFEGDFCDRCSPGYYNFPNCRPCNCDVGGTAQEACNEQGQCQCDGEGTCECKEFAEGKKCASCKQGTFGLSKENPKGCFHCFCFGRSLNCKQGDHIWTQVSSPTSRELTISRGLSDIEVSHGLSLIPSKEGDVKIGVESVFTTPLYWNLPRIFLGDKLTSYNGMLRFSLWSNGETPHAPDILQEYPLVQLQGNHRIIIEHFPQKINKNRKYEVRIHENSWVQKDTKLPVSREMLMIALQNVQKILIRHSDTMTPTKARLNSVSLDVGKVFPFTTPLRPAIGIEVCDCPPEYNSTSCQDPGIGFYRSYVENHVTSEIIIDLVGHAKKCECSGRSDICNFETGECLDCRENTSGPNCDICSTGFYGNPMVNDRCKPCQCPSADKNFADTCNVNQNGEFSCQCRVGYVGPKCDRCDYGFYGSPKKPFGKCLPCQCNDYGSQSDQCDPLTGQCFCFDGVTGRDCSQCKPRHVLTKTKACKDCNNFCTGVLLAEIEKITENFNESGVANMDPTPEITLKNYETRTSTMDGLIGESLNVKQELRSVWENAELLKPQGDLVDLEAQRLHKKGKKLQRKALRSIKDSENAKIPIKDISAEIQMLTQHLEQYATGSGSNVDITPALNEARNVLKSIQKLDFEEFYIETRTELSYAKRILQEVKDLIYGMEEVQDINTEIKAVEKLLNDLFHFINSALVQVRQAFKIVGENSEILEDAKRSISGSNKVRLIGKEHLKNGNKLTKTSDKSLTSALKVISDISDALARLEQRGKLLESEEIAISGVVEDYRTRYVLPCLANAEKLNTASMKLKAMFDSSIGIIADDALKAANVYQLIIKAMDEAREAGFKALDAAVLAFSRADPPGEDNLGVKSEFSRVRSEDLSQEAQGLHQNGLDMQIQLKKLAKQWRDYKSHLERSLKSIGIIQSELQRIPGVGQYAKDATNAAHEALRESEQVLMTIMELRYRIEHELLHKTKEMQSFSPRELGNIPRKLMEAKRAVQDVEKQSSYLTHRSKDIEELNLVVALSLESLRSKVELARHAADSVGISITADLEGSMGCLRSYRINKTANIFTRISLIYAIDTDERDGLLVYLPSTRRGDRELDTRDFMAIEMVNRKIRFLWNNGAGTQALISNVTLETARNLAKEDHMWYKITAERIGNIGRLNVRKVQPIYDQPDFHRWVVGESSNSAHILDLEREDLLYVGGVPEVYKTQHLQSHGKLAGVLYEVTVDHDRVGLWNFVDSVGCRETYIGITDVKPDHNCFSFNGKGYARQQNIRNYNSKYLSISMEFRSFDEESLLLLVINHLKKQFLAISLKYGKVRLHISYSPQEILIFETENTYNSGAWVKLEAARAKRNGIETGVLRVNFNGVREDLLNTIDLSGANQVFDMADCDIYFGGLPPNVKVAMKDISTRGFLGSLRGITVSNPGSNSILNPLYAERHKFNPFYGVRPNCEKLPEEVVSFEHDGFLELRAQELRNNSSFGFGFSTIQPEGLLMLSTSVGQNDNQGLKNFYSISIVNGLLQLALSSGEDPNNVITFVHDKVVNDGRLHNIAIVWTENRIKIFLDDNEISQPGGLNIGNYVTKILAPAEGGLFLGGIPSFLEFGVNQAKMTNTTLGFYGNIRNLAFLDDESVRVVAMNQPVSFFRADIGREINFFSPLHYKEDWLENVRGSRNFKHHCSNEAMNDYLDPQFSAQFRRHLNSSVLVRFNKEDLQKDFELSFDMRTFDQDGLLLASMNKKNMLMIYLQDTELRVNYHHRDTVLQMEVRDIFTYGRWKKIVLLKDGTDLTLIVDGHKSASMKVPRKLHLNKQVWLGRSEVEIDISNPNFPLIPTFSGCIRDLVITSRRVILNSNLNKLSGISRCPVEVESGFFIRRNGRMVTNIMYDIAKTNPNFYVIEMSFKPRTTGLFLSLHSNEAKLQLKFTQNSEVKGIFFYEGHYNEQVEESIALQTQFTRNPTQFKQNFSCNENGKFAWRHLKIAISQTLIRVEVNKQAQVFRHSAQISKIQGGELVLGHPIITSGDEEETFEGCFKNIQFNGIFLDERLFILDDNVFINSCPK